MIVRKECYVIPSSSDCLLCFFFPLSSVRPPMVDSAFVEIELVDNITSGLCFVVEIVGVGVASAGEKNGLIIINTAIKLATWILACIYVKQMHLTPSVISKISGIAFYKSLSKFQLFSLSSTTKNFP